MFGKFRNPDTNETILVNWMRVTHVTEPDNNTTCFHFSDTSRVYVAGSIQQTVIDYKMPTEEPYQ